MKKLITNLTSKQRALFIAKLRNQQKTFAKQQVLTRQERSTQIPLSPGQEGIWVYEELTVDSRRFLLPGLMSISGPLDVQLMEKAINAIIERHDALRTTIPVLDDLPVQHIADKLDYHPTIYDFRELTVSDKEHHLHELFAKAAEDPFDLTVLPLFRISLIRMEETLTYLMMQLHHIISDETSFEIFRYELMELYSALRSQRPHQLPELPIQFADYAIWKHHWLNSPAFESQCAYWQQQLAGGLAYLNLPMIPTADYDPATYKIAGEKAQYYELTLPDTLLTRLKALCHQEHVTLFMSFLGLFSLILYKYTGQQDIIISTPISERKYPETEHLIGYFITMILLRIRFSEQESFREVLALTRKTVSEAFSNQEIPFNIVFKSLKIDARLHNLTSHVAFNYMNSSQQKVTQESITYGQFEYAKAKIAHNLGLFVDDRGNNVSMAFSYKKTAFAQATIKRMATDFVHLLNDVLKNFEQPVANLIVPMQDIQQKEICETTTIPHEPQFNF